MPADRDRAGGNARARRCQPGRVEGRVEPGQVGEPGSESQKGRGVLPGRVLPRELFRRAAGPRRQLGQVGAHLPAIEDSDREGPSVLRRRERRAAGERFAAQDVVAQNQGIEEEREGACSRDGVVQAADCRADEPRAERDRRAIGLPVGKPGVLHDDDAVREVVDDRPAGAHGARPARRRQ